MDPGMKGLGFGLLRVRVPFLSLCDYLWVSGFYEGLGD